MTIKPIRKNGHWVNEIKNFIVVIVIALVIRSFIFSIYYVPTGSMNDTIYNGDYIFATKYDYGLVLNIIHSTNKYFERSPKRGDIVILYMPQLKPNCYIKRIIGLPGDKIAIKSGVIFVNGIAFQQEFLGFKQDVVHLSQFKIIRETNIDKKSYIIKRSTNCDIYNCLNDIPQFTIPDRHFYAMGDNRDFSNDSRGTLGLIPSENIIAKALFVFFSFNKTLFQTDYQEKAKNFIEWLASFESERVIYLL